MQLGESIVNRVPKLCWIRIALAASCILFFASSAQAGLGGYVEYGFLHYAALWQDDGFVEDGDLAHVMSAGVAWDSNLATDTLMNYRVNVGYRRLEGAKGDNDLQFDGLAFNLTLGFAPIRTEAMRIWAGPSIAASYLVCEKCAGPRDRADVHQATLGLGPEVGVNLHLGKVLTMSITGRYHFETNAQKTYFADKASFDRAWQGRAGLNISLFLRAEDDQFKTDPE